MYMFDLGILWHRDWRWKSWKNCHWPLWKDRSENCRKLQNVSRGYKGKNSR